MTYPLPSFLRDHLVYTSTRPYLVLDFETTNLEKGSALNPSNRLILACWYIVDPRTRSYQFKYAFGDEYEQQELMADIREAAYVVAFNAKFEAQWLARCGLDLRDVLFCDPMLGQWVLDGNLKLPRNLDAVAKRYGLGHKESIVSHLIKQGVCPSTIRRDWLLSYCKRDVHLTALILEKQMGLLADRDQLHLFHTRNLTAACLADIETQGMCLDPDAVTEEYFDTLRRRDASAATLASIAEGVNLNSPKQVGAFVYDVLGFKELTDRRGNPVRTAKGDRCTSSDVLSNLKVTNRDSIQQPFLDAYKEFNHVDALLSKNLLFFHKVCTERDARFFGIFNQGITSTHRLSSSGRPLVFAGETKARSVNLCGFSR